MLIDGPDAMRLEVKAAHLRRAAIGQTIEVFAQAIEVAQDGRQFSRAFLLITLTGPLE
jgi:hypothetical protein